ncbi:MAG: hypothetical protein CMO80_15040 [Verrucomicrobiales bacterium]|nr:hypothetical protein [Verrucomicrobiales bacterium]
MTKTPATAAAFTPLISPSFTPKGDPITRIVYGVPLAVIVYLLLRRHVKKPDSERSTKAFAIALVAAGCGLQVLIPNVLFSNAANTTNSKTGESTVTVETIMDSDDIGIFSVKVRSPIRLYGRLHCSTRRTGAQPPAQMVKATRRIGSSLPTALTRVNGTDGKSSSARRVKGGHG